MKVTIDIDDNEWRVLEPLLKRYIVSSDVPSKDNTPIDAEAILALECGTRIYNALKDGQWDESFTFAYKNYCGKKYSVVTMDDLKRVNRINFTRHRNVSIKSWRILKRYLETLFPDNDYSDTCDENNIQ